MRVAQLLAVAVLASLVFVCVADTKDSFSPASPAAQQLQSGIATQQQIEQQLAGQIRYQKAELRQTRAHLRAARSRLHQIQQQVLKLRGVKSNHLAAARKAKKRVHAHRAKQRRHGKRALKAAKQLKRVEQALQLLKKVQVTTGTEKQKNDAIAAQLSRKAEKLRHQVVMLRNAAHRHKKKARHWRQQRKDNKRRFRELQAHIATLLKDSNRATEEWRRAAQRVQLHTGEVNRLRALLAAPSEQAQSANTTLSAKQQALVAAQAHYAQTLSATRLSYQMLVKTREDLLRAREQYFATVREQSKMARRYNKLRRAMRHAGGRGARKLNRQRRAYQNFLRHQAAQVRLTQTAKSVGVALKEKQDKLNAKIGDAERVQTRLDTRRRSLSNLRDSKRTLKSRYKSGLARAIHHQRRADVWKGKLTYHIRAKKRAQVQLRDNLAGRSAAEVHAEKAQQQAEALQATADAYAQQAAQERSD